VPRRLPQRQVDEGARMHVCHVAHARARGLTARLYAPRRSLIPHAHGKNKHHIEAGGAEGIWGKDGNGIRTPGR
jgi:hypothetical protein